VRRRPVAASRRRWFWLLVGVIVLACLGGAAAGLWVAGVLPPKHKPTVSDAAFWSGVNGSPWPAPGLGRADARARADLTRAISGSMNLRLEEDGANIADSVAAELNLLQYLRRQRLSSSQISDLRLLDRFFRANLRYAVALQNDPVQGARSTEVHAKAALAAAADKVARSAAPPAQLPSPSVFTISSTTG
jgi:hypothetical protein